MTLHKGVGRVWNLVARALCQWMDEGKGRLYILGRGETFVVSPLTPSLPRVRQMMHFPRAKSGNEALLTFGLSLSPSHRDKWMENELGVVAKEMVGWGRDSLRFYHAEQERSFLTNVHKSFEPRA